MKYVRNPDLVRKSFAVNDAGQLIAKSACKIQIPIRFKDKGLAEIGIRTFTYGFFPIILSTGEYLINNVTALIELTPDSVTTCTIDEVEYYEFHFEKNSCVFKNMDVLKSGALMFNIFDEFIFLGKLPWYAEYEDVAKMFDTALKFAGSEIGNFPEVMEFIISMICRSKDDLSKYLRTRLTDYKQVELGKVAYVPLKSVYYSVNSTLNKIAGSYMSQGIDSAIVCPTTSTGTIERILRA